VIRLRPEDNVSVAMYDLSPGFAGTPCRNRQLWEKLADLIRRWQDYTARNGATINNNQSPGNKAGGLRKILEKSLGAAAKGGTTNLIAVYDYAESITAKGFVFMNTPGNDPAYVRVRALKGIGLRSINLYDESPYLAVNERMEASVEGVYAIGDLTAASEMVGQAVLAIQMEATLEELDKTPFPHPTLSESFAEAARDALGNPIYLP